MDYEQGEPLSNQLKNGATLSEAKITDILFPLLDGLETVHRASVTHRDIKPDNILIRSDGSPVLIDFGAARRKRPDGEKSQFAIFTPDYAAPEQVYGDWKQGAWTDIYSLGATLYRAVSGRLPTNASRRLQGEAYKPAVKAARAGYTPAFLAAIDAALALRPEDRPQSIADWRALFQQRTGNGDPNGGNGNRLRRQLITWSSVLGIAAAGIVGSLIGLKIYDDGSIVTDIGKTEIRARIRQAAGRLECARVRSDITSDGRVFLRGYVSIQGDLALLRDRVSAIKGVREIADDSLHVYPAPLCKVIGILNDYQMEKVTPRDAVTVWTNKPNADFKEDERIIVYARASSAFPDYLDSAGEVVHMLPSAIASSNSVQAGQQLTLGGGPCPANCYVASPPHGRNVVVALSTSSPLVSVGLRPEVESLDDYLPFLRAALKRLRSEGGKLISGYGYITTHE
jgi:hypothetical protein